MSGSPTPHPNNIRSVVIDLDEPTVGGACQKMRICCLAENSPENLEKFDGPGRESVSRKLTPRQWKSILWPTYGGVPVCVCF